MTADLHPATLWEQIAEAIPDATALVHGDRRWSWNEFDERSARLAGVLLAAGHGGGAKVGVLLYNTPEHVEVYFAALKIRAVPFNINYRYTATELAYLIDNADTDVLVYDARLTAQVVGALGRTARRPMLVQVGEGDLPAGGVRYEDAIAGAEPAPRIERRSDDVTMVYTGGTTGMPKGVVAKVGDLLTYILEAVPPLFGEPAVTTYDEAVALAQRLHAAGASTPYLPAPPLMHNTGLALGAWPALATGGSVVLLEPISFDADLVWDVVERERVAVLVVVGDAFARPLLRALAAGSPRDLTGLRYITSSGAMFSTEVKAGLLERLPAAAVIDVIAASEGTMGMSIATHDAPAATGSFFPLPGVMVIDEDGQELAPGCGVAGFVALPGGAEGYYKDQAKTAATFRLIDGRHYTVPGDLALIEADGMLTLLGRGSSCINTAGEKVFPEEVEEVLKQHPAVEDALVFGVPDERFGQCVAAVLSYAPGMHESTEVIVAGARERLTAYKLPRTVHVVDVVPRTDVGKPDYVTARRLFEEAAATGP